MAGRLLVLFCLIACAPFAHGAVIMENYTFADFDEGDLVGQDGWTSIGTNTIPVIKEGSGLITTNVAGSNSSGTSSWAVARKELPDLSLTGTETLTFLFDVIKDAVSTEAGTAGLILGDNTFSSGANYIGMTGNRWRLSGLEAVQANGNALFPTANKWFRVRSVWDLAAGTGTLEIMNLTDSQTEYTLLQFQNPDWVSEEATPEVERFITTLSLSVYGNPTGWSYLGLQTSGGEQNVGGDMIPRAGMIDNITIIPEPGSLSLLGGAFVAAMLIRRRVRK